MAMEGQPREAAMRLHVVPIHLFHATPQVCFFDANMPIATARMGGAPSCCSTPPEISATT